MRANGVDTAVVAIVTGGGKVAQVLAAVADTGIPQQHLLGHLAGLCFSAAFQVRGRVSAVRPSRRGSPPTPHALTAGARPRNCASFGERHSDCSATLSAAQLRQEVEAQDAAMMESFNQWSMESRGGGTVLPAELLLQVVRRARPLHPLHAGGTGALLSDPPAAALLTLPLRPPLRPPRRPHRRTTSGRPTRRRASRRPSTCCACAAPPSS
jgi:hypothetical protein